MSDFVKEIDCIEGEIRGHGMPCPYKNKNLERLNSLEAI